MGVMTSSAQVVVVDDDPMVASSLTKMLSVAGHRVDAFGSAQEAIAHLSKSPADVVISDVNMPGMTGLEMLAALRVARADVPVVFLTGAPRLEDTMRAMELGAFRYLAKPIDSEQLARVVRDAVSWGRLTRVTASDAPEASQRKELDAALTRSMATMQMAYQPIVSAASRVTFGYEALMRSQEPALRSPPDVLDAAEKLGRLHELGRRLRDITAAQVTRARPFDHTFFVNLHASDLADPTLYDPSSALAAFAPSVILEITERASLEGIADIERCITSLRSMGYRIAVDDLGAGYAGLSYFARVSPDVVKIDMSLTRNLDADPVRRRVVASICTLARELDILVVAEGIETEGELTCVRDLGADLIQGYLIAKPAPYPEK
jgi:EAL domain-containing protein (putative c-di-GMP-specific phosphodiesterase class I)